MRVALKQARERAGFTQEQMAKILGVTVRAYQFIESGDSDSRPKLWDRLEDLFNVDQRELRENTPESAKGSAVYI